MRERCVHCGNDLPDGSQDFMCPACFRQAFPYRIPDHGLLMILMACAALAIFSIAWYLGALIG